MQRMQVHGVLFDIDETLVDLHAAMGTTLRALGKHDLAHFTADEWNVFTALFAADPEGYYDRYLAGELSFADQRVRRVQHARLSTGQPLLDDDTAQSWNNTYEAMLPLHFRAFDDVVPLLDELDVRGIAYGAVSNNIHDYQRAKLDAAGLERIKILVGIDTVGAAKPDPAIFHEGVRLLGTDAAGTLYVGDNLSVDARGAAASGLRGVWLGPLRQSVAGADGPRCPCGGWSLRGSDPRRGGAALGWLMATAALPEPFCTSSGTGV